jgi:hypothetical protein
MKKIYCVLLGLAVLLTSCKNESKKMNDSEETKALDSVIIEQTETASNSKFVSQSTDQQTADNIKTFLVQDYLKEDLSFLQATDRKFQFYKIDLNGDGNDEIFVRFMSPYFCGSGGCTFLLLDQYGEIITRFSVTRAPIFVEPAKVNEWSLLLVKDAGVFKELTFQDGSYPANPSVLQKAPYDAPSGHAQVMFHDELYISKTFNF